MSKKNLYKVLAVVCFFLLLILVLSAKVTTSTKLYSPDRHYSVYTQTYFYSELFCAVFSTMDCTYAGKIYLYDELKRKIIKTTHTNNIESLKTVTWSIQNNAVFFKDNTIQLPNGFWVLP
jgi:hypothetical protein